MHDHAHVADALREELPVRPIMRRAKVEIRAQGIDGAPNDAKAIATYAFSQYPLCIIDTALLLQQPCELEPAPARERFCRESATSRGHSLIWVEL